MRKQTEYKQTHIIEEIFCDGCNKKVKTGEFSICSICDRDLCRDCYGNRKTYGTFFIPCKLCLKHVEEHLPKIESLWEESEQLMKKAREITEEWGTKSHKGASDE